MIPNAPPVELYGMTIDDLYDEAKNFLDGEPIKTQADADAVGVLLDRIRQVRKDADEQRKAEKKPHDEAAKAVQVAYAPLLAKCDLAAVAAKNALTPFLEAQEAARRDEAEKARAEADRLAAEALAARQATNPADLAAMSSAEAMLKVATDAEKAVRKIEKGKVQAATERRAIGLRTSYRAEITDMTAFARWAWANRRAEVETFFAEMADREGRHGPVSIPGLTTITERKAA